MMGSSAIVDRASLGAGSPILLNLTMPLTRGAIASELDTEPKRDHREHFEQAQVIIDLILLFLHIRLQLGVSGDISAVGAVACA